MLDLEYREKEMRKAVLCGALVVVLGLATVAAANSWTVGPGGDYATINAAVTAASPFDDIRVLTGTYAETVVVNKANLRIWADPADTAILDASGYGVGIDILGGGDFTEIDGLEVKNTGYVDGRGAGIGLSGGADSVTIRNCYVHDNSNIAIQSFGDNTLEGISDHLIVEACRLENNGDSGVKLYGSSHARIEGNTFKNNSDYGILVWNYHTPAGYTLDDIQVIGNHMWTNGYGIKIDGNDADGVTNAVVAFNDMFYGSDRGIRLDDYVTNAKIYNNTVDWYQKEGILIEDSSDNAVLRNNIVNGPGQDGIKQEDSTGIDSDYNDIYEWGAGYSAANGFTEGPNSIYVDPLFTAPSRPPGYDTWDYTLQPGSDCIDAGLDIGYPYFGSAPDMGAFEHQPGGPIPEPISLIFFGTGLAGVFGFATRRRMRTRQKIGAHTRGC